MTLSIQTLSAHVGNVASSRSEKPLHHAGYSMAFAWVLTIMQVYPRMDLTQAIVQLKDDQDQNNSS